MGIGWQRCKQTLADCVYYVYTVYILYILSYCIMYRRKNSKICQPLGILSLTFHQEMPEISSFPIQNMKDIF